MKVKQSNTIAFSTYDSRAHGWSENNRWIESNTHSPKTYKMKRNLFLTLVILLVGQLAWSQTAEPAVSGANFVPNSITVGDTSRLTISFANSGFDPIPPQSIELTISSAFEYYLMKSTPPSGPAGPLFSWVYLGTDVWRGTNINAIPAFGGGDIHVDVVGVKESPAFEATNINVQPVKNLAMFENAPGNDNLQPELQVLPPSCYASSDGPELSANTISNNCPTDLTVDLDDLYTSSLPSFTSIIWSTDGNGNNGPSSQISSIVGSPGTYYAYLYDSKNVCYSAASNPVTVSILSCNNPPLAQNDEESAYVGTPIVIDVLDNDSDIDNHNITISFIGGSAEGATPVLNGNNIIYTPPTGFVGRDSFMYRICDNGNPSHCDEAMVIVDVYDFLTFQNDCPNEWIDISDIHDGALPAGTEIVWSTDNDKEDGLDDILDDKVYESTIVYVYYYDPIGACYSPGIKAFLDIDPCNVAPIANDDTASGDEDEDVNGTVAGNDLDPDGNPLTYTEIVGPDNGSVVLNPNGTYTYTPNVGFTGQDEFTYQVCDNGVPQRCDTAVVTISINVVDIICADVRAKVFLEGAIIDPDGEVQYMNEMRTDLNDLKILPGQSYSNGFSGNAVYSPKGHPYAAQPWQYDGTEGDNYDSNGNTQNGDAGYPASVVDWVLVSLRESPSDEESSVVCQQAALLHKDGSVTMETPCCGIDRRKEYFIVVEHRNHLLVMSPTKVSTNKIIEQNSATYAVTHDFTTQNSYKSVDPNFLSEIGFGQKEVNPGVWAMIGGNAEQKYTQDDTDMTVDDEVIWGLQNSIIGLYRIGDFNMNADINFNDRVIWEENNGVFSSVPRDKNQ